MSVCGNNVLEEQEECDCGLPEECVKENPCCDPLTCKFVKHAQCSSGPCCKKCKLLSPDHLCRPAGGECDVAEFCDGKSGQCPGDIYKKNGAICSGGLGYCFQGLCPVLKKQCQDVWGEGAESGNALCFERLNVQGTPNGNCGSDGVGEIRKCEIEDSHCGTLQCSQGNKTPMFADKPPINFAISKMNSEGVVHECKALSSLNVETSLVKDGTKCGYQKLCINQTCTSIKSIVFGKCPLEEFQAVCSGHGVCTNLNTCSCGDGWKGHDCSIKDEDSQWTGIKGNTEYYDSIEGSQLGTSNDDNEIKLSPNLAITVIAAAVFIGVGLVIVVVLFIIYRNMKVSRHH